MRQSVNSRARLSSTPPTTSCTQTAEGAHAAKAEFKEALLDANKCIDLNKDWAKGHSRRGAAYVGLRNWPSAQAAYEKGLELDPSSTIIKEELEKVKIRRNPSSAPGHAQQHQQHQQHYAQAYAQAAQGSAAGGPQTTGMAPILSLGAVMCGFFYTVPVLGASRALLAYRMSVVFVLLLFILTLYRAFPLKMATLSDPKFTGAMEQQAFVLTVFMLLSPPMPFALMPFLSLAFLNVCHTYGSKVANLPFIGPRIVYFTTPEGTFQVLAFGAVSEVMVAFMTPMLIVLQATAQACSPSFSSNTSRAATSPTRRRRKPSACSSSASMASLSIGSYRVSWARCIVRPRASSLRAPNGSAREKG